MAPPPNPGGPTAPAGDPWRHLASHTSARIGLGRAGGSVPTRPLLEFQLAHARARDAVARDLDCDALAAQIALHGLDVLHLASAAGNRPSFIARPDLGRTLDAPSRDRLAAHPEHRSEVILIVADGLSALAIERHAAPFLDVLIPALRAEQWRVGPLCIARQGRVALMDEIGALLQAKLAVMLIGERPGLSSPDSLGIYLTWNPLPGRGNAERNCLSNIRPPEGMGYALAAHKLTYLMREARRRQLTGIDLKDDAPALATPENSERLA